jgi:hypothetical protein
MYTRRGPLSIIEEWLGDGLRTGAEAEGTPEVPGVITNFQRSAPCNLRSLIQQRANMYRERKILTFAPLLIVRRCRCHVSKKVLPLAVPFLTKYKSAGVAVYCRLYSLTSNQAVISYLLTTIPLIPQIHYDYRQSSPYPCLRQARRPHWIWHDG